MSGKYDGSPLIGFLDTVTEFEKQTQLTDTLDTMIESLELQLKAKSMLLDNADLQVEMLTKMLSHFIPGLKFADIDERFDYYFKETDLDDDEIAERTVQDLLEN